jgi:DNA helicase HerA-like ATPase
MEIKSTDLAIIAGKRGSGKSTLLKALMATTEPSFIQNYGYGYIKIDPLGELQGTYIDYGDRLKYNQVLKEAFEKKNQFIVTDEADGFFPNRKSLSKLETRFIHIGRHWGLGGMFVTRRLANLSTDLVTQANKIFIFKHWQRADLDYLSQSGLSEYIDDILTLDSYEFLVVDTDTGDSFVSEPI